MAYNAGERKDVRRAEKQAKLAEQQRREVIAQIMSNMAGRSWMLEKLEECHVFRTSYSREPTVMAFNEGQRDIGLRLLNDIMVSCPDNYILMMRESNERRSASEYARSQNGDGRNQESGPEPTDGTTEGADSASDGAAEA